MVMSTAEVLAAVCAVLEFARITLDVVVLVRARRVDGGREDGHDHA
jgi:hypothetical protein